METNKEHLLQVLQCDEFDNETKVGIATALLMQVNREQFERVPVYGEYVAEYEAAYDRAFGQSLFAKKRKTAFDRIATKAAPETTLELLAYFYGAFAKKFGTRYPHSKEDFKPMKLLRKKFKGDKIRKLADSYMVTAKTAKQVAVTEFYSFAVMSGKRRIKRSKPQRQEDVE